MGLHHPPLRAPWGVTSPTAGLRPPEGPEPSSDPAGLLSGPPLGSADPDVCAVCVCPRVCAAGAAGDVSAGLPGRRHAQAHACVSTPHSTRPTRAATGHRHRSCAGTQYTGRPWTARTVTARSRHGPPQGLGPRVPFLSRRGRPGRGCGSAPPGAHTHGLGHGLDGLCGPQLTGDAATARHAAPGICSCAGRPGGPHQSPSPPTPWAHSASGAAPEPGWLPPGHRRACRPPHAGPCSAESRRGGQGALTRLLIAAATCGGSSEPRAHVDGERRPVPRSPAGGLLRKELRALRLHGSGRIWQEGRAARGR